MLDILKLVVMIVIIVSYHILLFNIKIHIYADRLNKDVSTGDEYPNCKL